MNPSLRRLLPSPLTLALAVALLAAGGARASSPGGSLVITKEATDTSQPDWEATLKRNQIETLHKGVDGWKIFLLAYLNKAAGSDEVNLVFYDLTGGGREQVNHFPIGTRANAKIITSEVQISAEQGFKADHKYQVLITRIIGGKEVVYAKTTLTLK